MHTSITRSWISHVIFYLFCCQRTCTLAFFRTHAKKESRTRLSKHPRSPAHSTHTCLELSYGQDALFLVPLTRIFWRKRRAIALWIWPLVLLSVGKQSSSNPLWYHKIWPWSEQRICWHAPSHLRLAVAIILIISAKYSLWPLTSRLLQSSNPELEGSEEGQTSPDCQSEKSLASSSSRR